MKRRKPCWTEGHIGEISLLPVGLLFHPSWSGPSWSSSASVRTTPPRPFLGTPICLTLTSFTNDVHPAALNSWLQQSHAQAQANRRNATPGPSSRASGPPSSRWPTPPPRFRLSPLPEGAAKTFAADPSAALEAWDPNSRRASVERALKIRTCADLATLLLTVPDYYRGVLSKVGSDLYSALDSLDVNGWWYKVHLPPGVSRLATG